jgi:hypothetical protein
MAKVDGQVVRVGDVVCFKSDYEQTGRIVAIKQSIMGSDVLDWVRGLGLRPLFLIPAPAYNGPPGTKL